VAVLCPNLSAEYRDVLALRKFKGQDWIEQWNEFVKVRVDEIEHTAAALSGVVDRLEAYDPLKQATPTIIGGGLFNGLGGGLEHHRRSLLAHTTGLRNKARLADARFTLKDDKPSLPLVESRQSIGEDRALRLSSNQAPFFALCSPAAGAGIFPGPGDLDRRGFTLDLDRRQSLTADLPPSGPLAGLIAQYAVTGSLHEPGREVDSIAHNSVFRAPLAADNPAEHLARGNARRTPAAARAQALIDRKASFETPHRIVFMEQRRKPEDRNQADALVIDAELADAALINDRARTGDRERSVESGPGGSYA
jgi:hypothetical protein